MAKKKYKQEMRKQLKEFVFEENFSIGGVSAEDDPLLDVSFLETNHYASIVDMDDPHFALVGRSGTGKTAIINRIKKQFQHHIVIKPETLAFQFLGTSDMVNTLREKNVTLDYFYKLLWRHVFVVEILKHYFPDETNRVASIRQLFSNLKKPFAKDKEKERAMGYMDQWGATLLQAPEERVKNIHDTLEKQIKAKLGGTGKLSQLLSIDANIEGGLKSTREIAEKISIVKQEINTIQIQDLNAARDYISAAVLDDPQKPCFVLIDDLDRFLAEDNLYYELIRALILESYDWARVENIKVVYALRDNILHKVEADFTTKSYQREKFEDHRIHLRWIKTELINLVDERLSSISKLKKLDTVISTKQILPPKSGDKPKGEDYMLARTLERPRDIIDFINRAGKLSVGKKRIPWVVINRVESSYSRGRMDALIDEWRDNCEGLEELLKLLRNGPPRFPLLWWSDQDITELLTDHNFTSKGWCSELASLFDNLNKQNPQNAINTCRKKILQLLYEVGIVGVKISASDPFRYCYTNGAVLQDYEITQIQNPMVIVHPTFHKALGIQTI
ncbi:P-loop ATPase, Sll1717 family [Chloroflexota bacterium]